MLPPLTCDSMLEKRSFFLGLTLLANRQPYTNHQIPKLGIFKMMSA